MSSVVSVPVRSVSVSTQTDMTAPDLSLIFSLKGAAAAEASAGRKRRWSHRSRRGATGSQPASPEEQQARSSGGAAAAAAVEELHPDVWPPLSPQNLGRWDEGDEGRDEGRRWGRWSSIGVFDIGVRGSEFSIARRHGGIPLEILASGQAGGPKVAAVMCPAVATRRCARWVQSTWECIDAFPTRSPRRPFWSRPYLSSNCSLPSGLDLNAV